LYPGGSLLDVQLPDGDGYDVCAEVRQCECYIPIIMISGVKRKLAHRELGLDKGADHYFHRPVRTREVVAQVKALLRMAGALKKGEAAVGLSLPPSEATPEMQFGALDLDFVKGEFKRGDRSLALTALEIKLLACLNQNAGQVLTANELLKKVWRDRSSSGKADDCRLKNAIKRLRQKIERDPKHPRYLLTARGGGYYLCLNPESD
jgi:two-component system alkaline phosphatase synthesis response regulator PhoP